MKGFVSMQNELLLIISLVILFGGLLFVLRLFGRWLQFR